MKSLETQLKITVRRLKEEPSICAAFLHGSGAKGTLRKDSDIDIALHHVDLPNRFYEFAS